MVSNQSLNNRPSLHNHTYDCIILGGGAAGLFCALHAGQLGRKILVLDRANKVGKKILMSGGGRCNFTNYYAEPDNYLSNNTHFCISALSRYTQYDFIAWVEKYGLAYHEKTAGQLFCDNRSKDLLAILLKACEMSRVDIKARCQIENIQTNSHASHPKQRFQLNSNLGNFSCESLVIATGGPSIPSLGSSGFGYEIARQFGLNVTECTPSLVPFTLQGELLGLAKSLAGVALPITVNCRGQSFHEALLFTHKGLSGPAILQISNYWYAGDCITINFLPSISLGEQLTQWQQQGEKKTLKNQLTRYLPKRFTEAWLSFHTDLKPLANKTIKQLSQQDIQTLIHYFHHWTVIPSGTEGYKTAEVTRGGVNTDEVSSKTFETKKVPGLYFIGEVLDVTGWLGGYNFQWAWASGYCAAQYV